MVCGMTRRRFGLGSAAAFVAILVVLPSDVSLAGANVWTTHGPEGGGIISLAVDPLQASTVYSGSIYGGAFKSTNGGRNWFPLHKRPARPGLVGNDVTNNPALVVDPPPPTTPY